MNGFGVSPLEILASEAMLNGQVYIDEFVYGCSWVKGTATALGSLATVEIQIQINGDSDFIVQEQNLTATENDAPIFPNYLLTMVRAGSGREVMSTPIHVANVCGAYNSMTVGSGFVVPAKKPCPGLLQMSNTVTVRLQNLTTDEPDRVDFSLIGFKVFYTGSANRQQIFHAT